MTSVSPARPKALWGRALPCSVCVPGPDTWQVGLSEGSLTDGMNEGGNGWIFHSALSFTKAQPGCAVSYAASSQGC